MSALLQWGQQNPKKAGLLSMVGLIGGYKTFKQWLATPKSLKDKIVIITGGAGGLGKMIGLKLYNEGSTVIVWDVNKESISSCNNEGKLIAKFVDVTNKSEVDREANEVLKKYGRIDILVNNAGVVAGRPLFELSEKDIRRTFDVNTLAHFWTLKAFLPSMIKHKSGHIVNIISMTAEFPVSYLTDYGSSKYAARGFDIGVKRELMDLGMDEGIVFTGVYPYFMNTGMFDGATRDDGGAITDMLEPEYVAQQALEAIQYEKRQIFLPYRMGIFLLYFKNLLPFGYVDDMAKKSNSMKHFVGGKNRLSKL
eukprot:334339_1